MRVLKLHLYSIVQILPHLEFVSKNPKSIEINNHYMKNEGYLKSVNNDEKFE